MEQHNMSYIQHDGMVFDQNLETDTNASATFHTVKININVNLTTLCFGENHRI